MGAAEPTETVTERPDDATETEAEAEVVPFFDVLPAGGIRVQVRAGWERDGEPEQVTMSAIVNVFEAQDFVLAAYTWTVRRWQELLGPAEPEETDADAAE